LISYETIVVDGGSTDGTLEYLEALKQKNKIVLIRQLKPEGAVRAFQPALDAARGEYIIFRHDHSITFKEPILQACRLMDSMPEVEVVFEHLYKTSMRVNTFVDIHASYFAGKEAFIIRGKNRFQIDKKYISYGWAGDKLMQIFCSGKIVVGLKHLSYIDIKNIIDKEDELHQKFKSGREPSNKSDGELLRDRSDKIYKVVHSMLPKTQRIRSCAWYFFTYKVFMKFLHKQFSAIFLRPVSNLCLILGYQVVPQLPEVTEINSGTSLWHRLLKKFGYSERRRLNEKGVSKRKVKLDSRFHIPYLQSIYELFLEKNCPFLDHSLIPQEFQNDFHFVQKLPEEFVQALANENIWN